MKMIKKMIHNYGGGGGSGSGSLYLPQEILIDQILTRLPVKTLLRFKLVCKLWCYSIQDDPHFADLHFKMMKKKKKNQSMLISFPCKLYTSNLGNILYHTVLVDQEGGKDKAKLLGLPLSVVKSCLNGLVIYYTYFDDNAHVCNPTTKQTLTLPKFILTPHHDYQYRCFELGFDSVTKVHKVLYLSSVYNTVGEGKNAKTTTTYMNCSIITLAGTGNSCWRKLDQDPPYRLKFWSKTYDLNGGILYWRSFSDWFNTDPPIDQVIVAFNFTDEKFRVIQLPDTIDLWRPREKQLIHYLLYGVVEGHLALTVSGLLQKLNKTMVLWILEDSDKQLWTRKTFPMAYCSNEVDLCKPIGTLPTGEVIMRPIAESRQYAWLYYYDLRNNTSRKVEFAGLPSQEYCPGPRLQRNFSFNCFQESLYFWKK